MIRVAMFLFAVGAALWAHLSHAQDKSDRILIIYNHGSGHGHDCKGNPVGWGGIPVPRWVRRLDGITIAGRSVEVRGLCTDAGDDHFRDAAQVCDLSICRRAKLAGKFIELAVEEGFQRRHIFLAGQSAGAWTSLMVKRAEPKSVNGLLLTAPAYGGKRSERLCKQRDCLDLSAIGGRYRAQARAEVDKWLAGQKDNPPDLNARIVTFHCDAFGEGWELPTEGNPSVDRTVYPPLKNVSEPLPCERSERRFYNGKERELCFNSMPPKSSVSCGEKRIRTCPFRYRHLCKARSHGMAFHSAFTSWTKRNKLAETFIAQAIETWPYGDDGAPASAAPCPFVQQIVQCVP